MSVTYTLATPVNVGTLTAPVNVSTLQITSIWLSTTPALAPLGTAELSITLTDPVSGWQETIDYQDATVLTFFSLAAPPPTAGATMQDIMSQALFSKLLADKKLPTGTVTTT